MRTNRRKAPQGGKSAVSERETRQALLRDVEALRRLKSLSLNQACERVGEQLGKINKREPYSGKYIMQVMNGTLPVSDQLARAVQPKPEAPHDPWIPALIAFALLCVGIGVLIGAAL